MSHKTIDFSSGNPQKKERLDDENSVLESWSGKNALPNFIIRSLGSPVVIGLELIGSGRADKIRVYTYFFIVFCWRRRTLKKTKSAKLAFSGKFLYPFARVNQAELSLGFSLNEVLIDV